MPALPSSGQQSTSRYYTGDSGQAYLDRFQEAMAFSALVSLPEFQPEVRASDVVADFGCGAGGLLELLTAKRKIGIEPNEAARAVAAQRGIETVATTTALQAASVDVVVSSHALEHVLEPFRELCELRQVLRPGGRLVLRLPLDDWRTHRRLEADPNHHLYTWTPLLLRNLLMEAGFEAVTCRVVVRAWPPRHALALHRYLPRPAFEALSYALAVGLRRRQLAAVARRPAE